VSAGVMFTALTLQVVPFLALGLVGLVHVDPP
jgi:hypothetical protein